VFFDQPMLARLVAPNVVRAIKGYSDAELARLLRHGVRPDGRGVAVMPSSTFYHLDDADLGGHTPNALPQLARANVNCRVLPNHDVKDVRATLVRLAGIRPCTCRRHPSRAAARPPH
jgi:acetylornithine deacetylase/succinyl-diaminopimelate desuccinylase-like protein